MTCSVIVRGVQNSGRLEVYPTEDRNLPHIRACAELVDAYVDWGAWLTPITLMADFRSMPQVDLEEFIKLLFKEDVVLI